MSLSIFLRTLDDELWLAAIEPLTMSPDVADALSFPNLVAAQEAFGRFGGDGLRMKAAAVNRATGEAADLGECEALVPIEQTPLRGAVVLFASLKKSSKYHGQFRGWEKVSAVIAPSEGDHYCFRVAHNAYRHEDLILGVKLPNGEIMRLDKWVAAERKVAA